MRRALIVIAVILAILLVAVGIIYLSARNEINSIVAVASVSEEEWIRRRDESQAALEDEFSKAGINLAEIAEKAAEQSGDAASASESAWGSEGGGAAAHADQSSAGSETGASAGASSSDASGNAAGGSGNSASGVPAEAQLSDEPDVESILMEFYRLQSSYAGRLDGVQSSAIAEYDSLPPEQHTTGNKISIGRQAVSTVVALEQSCDGEVSALAEKLRTALERNGMDSSLADQIVDYYVNAKNAQKAAYLSKYKKYLS